MEAIQMKCCSCSKGCDLHVRSDNDSPILVTGGACHRGEAYALKVLELEKMEADKAVYRGYVRIKNGYISHLLVISDREIPNEYFSSIDKELEVLIIEAPIEKNQVVYEDVRHSEVKILSSRGMKQRKR